MISSADHEFIGSDSSSIVACERIGLRLVVSPDRILDVLDGSGLAQRV